MDVGELIAAIGGGSIVTAIISWLRDRKKIGADADKVNVDTTLMYMKAVIERMDEDIQRIVTDRDRVRQELVQEQMTRADLTTVLKAQIKELEEKVSHLTKRLREFVPDF